jgi:hypothetical protein
LEFAGFSGAHFPDQWRGNPHTNKVSYTAAYVR